MQPSAPQEPAAHRSLEVLVGMRAIARFLKVRNRRVRDMQEEGAPIARDARGSMRADKEELWEWFRKTQPGQAVPGESRRVPQRPPEMPRAVLL